METPPFQIETARPEDWASVFRLLFQRTPLEEREARVAHAMQLLRTGELDPQGLLAARRGRELLGAIACLPVPGASGLVWPPQIADSGQQAELEDALVQRAGQLLRQGGARLGQALLNPAEADLGRPLLRNGFTHITSLWYMRHFLDLSTEVLTVEERLTYQPWTRDPRRFQETLLLTYEGTRDCPEVNGIRTLDEVLEGHRAQGRYDPERWWLALARNRPVGVLLLTELLDGQGWDVSYIGVVPAARRRGVGRELLSKALLEARTAEAGQLTLSVDARNQPAWNLYSRLCFVAFDYRDVFLAFWNR
jgi:ribosomal protein S18 acetylase RimI-like enzyme